MQNRQIKMHLTAPVAAQSGASQNDWWLISGDQVLAGLITQGLLRSTPLACEAAALAPVKNHKFVIVHHVDAGAVEASYRYADHRARIAAAIAHAYVDVRKWQSLLALRTGVRDQYRDNAEIARFRREAGLVSAVDGGLAGTLSSQNNGAQERTSARLEAGLRTLSNLAGMPAAELALQMSGGTVPDSGLLPPSTVVSVTGLFARADLLALKSHLERKLLRQKVSQAKLDQAMADPVEPESALATAPAQAAVAVWRHAFAQAEAEIRTLAAVVAEADAQLQTLPRQETAAQRAVADARLAYRAGTGDFATLFVAEVAALAIREALVEAYADRAGAIIDLRTVDGEGWNPVDLAPAAITAAAARKGEDCE